MFDRDILSSNNSVLVDTNVDFICQLGITHFLVKRPWRHIYSGKPWTIAMVTAPACLSNSNNFDSSHRTGAETVQWCRLNTWISKHCALLTTAFTPKCNGKRRNHRGLEMHSCGGSYLTRTHCWKRYKKE